MLLAAPSFVSRFATTLPPPAVPAKVCPCCAAVYTRDEWRDLPYVGRASDGDGGTLEYRNCAACTSTIVLPSEDA